MKKVEISDHACSTEQQPLASGNGSSVEVIETNENRQEASITSNVESSSGSSHQTEAAAPTVPVVSTTSSESVKQSKGYEILG